MIKRFWQWLTCRNWTAFYLPSTEGEDPTRSGFRSRKAARSYAQTHYCRPDCAGCDAEWLFVPTQTLMDHVLDVAGLFKAAGFKEVKR